MVKKRERLEVIRDILSVIRDSGKMIRPTRLLYSSNLSPQMFKDYMKELISKELVVEIEDKTGKKAFVLSNKGFEFLEKYRLIEEFVENFGL